jgi:hypothetical protein
MCDCIGGGDELPAAAGLPLPRLQLNLNGTPFVGGEGTKTEPDSVLNVMAQPTHQRRLTANDNRRPNSLGQEIRRARVAR